MKYSGYLTEDKLFDILVSIGFDCQREVKIQGHSYRYDVVFRKDDIEYFVEFHGYHHFTSFDVIQRDIRKKELAEKIGRYVEIPYFVQLNDESFLKTFGFYQEISTDFKSGFHDKKALLPRDFNSHGMQRFLKIINEETYGQQANNEIIESLQSKIQISSMESILGIGYKIS